MTTYQTLCLGLTRILSDENKNNRTNVVEFVKKASKLLKHDKSNNENKIELLVVALKQVAKGNDGIFGTEDDLIPKDIIFEIQQMSKTSLLEDLVTIFIKRKKTFVSKLTLFFKCYHAFT